MDLYKANTKNIEKAAEAIKSGKLVAFPTETVYGLGADGLNPIAVAKIFEAKKRPTFNPLILHVANKTQLNEVCFAENRLVEVLISKFWPGPLTIVLPKKSIVPDIITAGHATVAVRMPLHPVALKLIEKSEVPIAAPSANAFSRLSPTKAEHVENQLGDAVDLILDGGKCNVGVESTIVKITDSEIFLLRPGGLPVENIESVINTKLQKAIADTNNPVAPGMLPFHYSPKIPLRLLSRIKIENINPDKTAAIFFRNNNTGTKFSKEIILSKSGLHTEAAANLFSALHELEKENYELIVAEEFEEVGLGRAIMDRLNKATKRFESI